MISMVIQPNKVCPVVIRSQNAETSILAFRHPVAGNQLVKGSIEKLESPEEAALRELFEESGIEDVRIARSIGVWESGYLSQVWHVFQCDTPKLPDQWVHRTEDDGGRNFTFFWHPLKQVPGSCWHPLYRDALKWIVANL